MLNPQSNLRTGLTYWQSRPLPHIPVAPLISDRKTEVIVIGAGITGAMAAEELTAAGLRVTIVDRRGPLQGATAATTALLQYEIDLPLTELQKTIGHADAARAWRRSKLGLESLAAKVQALGIRCAYKRVSSLYLAGPLLDATGLAHECQARNAIGLHTAYLTRKALQERYGITRSAALLSFDTLSVDPLKLAAGFLRRALANGAQLFAPVTVEDVECGPEKVAVRTGDGPVLTARYVVYAMGYEMPKAVRPKRHTVHSTYAMATKPQPQNLWPDQCHIWEAAAPYLYARTTPDGRVLCGGEDEEFQDEAKRDALLAHKTACLEKKLHRLFPQLDCHAAFAWCGSFGASPTGLPTIGAIPDRPGCFAIMAFGGNGITYSRIAAEVIASQITGRNDLDADLFAFT
ncbi:MAG TPA: FAD-dependent oxidoreductase [Aestuariivirgaceae bacterium]|nr:FAD-dependent oxidoreductase [Aestuariivirgaceae bacterium]